MALRENEGAPERYRIQVEPEVEGQRLDRFLTDSLEGLSRERIKEVVLDGGVSIDGAVELRNSTSVHAGTWIDVVVTLRDRTRAGSQGGAEYTLLYEDADILVVGKPAGMVVHPSERVRGGTLSELLAIKYPGLPSPQGEDRPGIVHRLDAETSGVLVIARTEAAGEELKRQFKAREVHKVYTAIVYGELRFDADWIEEPIGRMRGSERVGVLSVANGGRKASTFYRTVERLGQATLIHCEPRTGPHAPDSRAHGVDRTPGGGRQALPRQARAAAAGRTVQRRPPLAARRAVDVYAPFDGRTRHVLGALADRL